MLTLLAATLLTSASCSATRPDDITISQDETGLHIVKRDGAGRVVGEATLTLGPVTVDGEAFEEGRHLEITTGGATFTHDSGGLAPLSLPVKTQPAIAAFVDTPAVAAALAAWDVEFRIDPPRDAEVAFAGSACTNSGCSSTWTADCCLDGTAEYRVCGVAANNIGTYAERYCRATSEFSCGAGGGTYPCCNSSSTTTCPSGSSVVSNTCSGQTRYACSSPCGTLGAAGCAVCSSSTYDGSWSFGSAWLGDYQTCGINVNPLGSVPPGSHCGGGTPCQSLGGNTGSCQYVGPYEWDEYCSEY